ncbi:MAG: matrixin family metalloprotease [Chloroflexi bacterium]|nr:matrixin family metalloprotease [Chloroflexota bacterium]
MASTVLCNSPVGATGGLTGLTADSCRHRLWLAALSLLASLLLFFIFSGTAQAIILRLSLEKLVSGADNIILGQVSAISSQWNAGRTNIVTSVIITVEEEWKGARGNGSVVVTVPGGTVDGITERVSDMPGFVPDERVVLFLVALPGGEFEIYGQSQGKLIVAGDTVAGFALADFKERLGHVLSGDTTAFETGTMATAQLDLANASVMEYDVTGAPQITTIDPPRASAGTNTQVTITGTNFGTTPGVVSFFYRTAQPFITANIISWTDTSIVATVPIGTVNSYPASASSGPVYVHRPDGVDSPWFPFTLSFSYGGRKWDGSSPSVTIAINPNTADTTGEELAVKAAVDTWNAVPNHGFRFVVTTGTATEPGYGGGGENDVMWKDLGGTGPIARVSSWEIGGTVVEADLVFNDYHTWSTEAVTPGNQIDVQSIALHELGHFLVLSDIYGDQAGYPQDTAKVMYGRYYAGDMKRALTPDDIAGIQWIYPAVVTFPDANLEAAIREALNKATGDITQSDMATLTRLDAISRAIADLTGLEFGVNLTELRLDSNQIGDLSPLASLTGLTRLELQLNRISDLTPMVSLTNLARLDLRDNQISDIKPLVDNTGLAQGDELDLQGNPLRATSLNTYIPQLQARGVTVSYDPNQPPAMPANVAPAAGSTVLTFTPALEASAFSDVDTGDTHAASQWQVSKVSGDYTSPVFDSGTDTANLTSITIPAGRLKRNTTYYWRVRYQDSRGAASDWSAETAFSLPLTGDANGDGKVNALDITKTERIVAKLDAATPLADANLDGSLDATDVTLIERIIAGLER